MDGRRGGAPFHDLGAVGAQVIRRDLGQQTVPPDGLEFTLEDGAAHGARAVGHGRARQPLLSELAEALGFLDPALLPPLLDGGRPPLGDHPFRVQAQFARPGECDPISGVLAKMDGLPPAVQPVVEPERDAACRCDAHIHAVTI